MLSSAVINVDVNVNRINNCVTAISFGPHIGCCLRFFVEKGCRQEWAGGKGGGTSPKPGERGEEKAWAQKSDQSRQPWGHAGQQALGLWCQVGAGTGWAADDQSCWCHDLGLRWWDEGVWGGKKTLRGPPGRCLRHQRVLPAVYLITFAAKTIQLHWLIYSFSGRATKLKNNNKSEAGPVKPWVKSSGRFQWGAWLGRGTAAA